MKLSVFEKIKTREDLENLVGLLDSLPKEHGGSARRYYMVDDVPFDGVVYAMSTIRDDCPVRHFFLYDGVVKGLYGLLVLDSRSTELVEIIEPNYVSLSYLHNRVWLATRPDSLKDLYIDNKLVATDILGHDIIDINGLRFVQLDFSDSRGLICCDSEDPFDGVFIPKNKSDFKRYFDKMLYMRGREGFLDEFSLSGIFGCYFEVVNTIFEYKYRYILG